MLKAMSSKPLSIWFVLNVLKRLSSIVMSLIIYDLFESPSEIKPK